MSLHLGVGRRIALLVMLLAVRPAYAIVGGEPVPEARSGFVSFRTAMRTCSGVMVASDLALTTANCFNVGERLHPVVIGWFMGDQDNEGSGAKSNRNPIQEILIEPTAGQLALVRFTRPLDLGGQMWPLHGGELASLDRRPLQLLCYSYGPRTTNEALVYGATLSRASFPVAGRSGSNLNLQSNYNPLHVFGPWMPDRFDVGGACFDQSRPGAAGWEIAGIIVDNGVGAPNVVAVSDFRAWVNRARASYDLVAEHSGKCLDVSGASGTPGTGLQQWDCHGGANQRLLVREIEGNAYELRAQHDNLCLGIAASRGEDGVPLVQWPCAGEMLDPDPSKFNNQSHRLADQGWMITPAGNGTVSIRNLNSGKCLGVAGAGLGNGAAVQQFKCMADAANQRWRFRLRGIDDGVRRLVGNKSTCLTIPDASQAAGALGKMIDCKGDAHQQWRVTAAGDQHFQLLARHTNFAQSLSVMDYAQRDGQGVGQWQSLGQDNQQWRFDWVPGKGFLIRSKQSKRQLDMCLTPSRDGGAATAQVRSCADAEDQRWNLE